MLFEYQRMRTCCFYKETTEHWNTNWWPSSWAVNVSHETCLCPLSFSSASYVFISWYFVCGHTARSPHVSQSTLITYSLSPAIFYLCISDIFYSSLNSRCFALITRVPPLLSFPQAVTGSREEKKICQYIQIVQTLNKTTIFHESPDIILTKLLVI